MTNAKGVLEWMEWKKREKELKANMSNDEWRRTCSAEEFAKWIYDIRFDFQIPWKNKEIMRWLKEKHNAE